jgi:hypothetical protein
MQMSHCGEKIYSTYRDVPASLPFEVDGLKGGNNIADLSGWRPNQCSQPWLQLCSELGILPLKFRVLLG